MYMDDIKLIAKNEKELETLIPLVRIYSQDIGMEFVREKCVMLIIKSRKGYRAEGIEQKNQNKIRTLGEMETYKYLRILETSTIKHAVMKEKIKKEYLMRTRKLLEIKQHCKNLIKGVNT